jgi:uncharacterized protein YebE (UPF0316 family)
MYGAGGGHSSLTIGHSIYYHWTTHSAEGSEWPDNEEVRTLLTDLLIIFALEALYVTVTTVRWIILVRGQRLLAAAISFFEIILYVVALGMVFTQLGDPLRVGVYALGYAVGALAGSLVEERLAIGYTVFHVITQPGTILPTRLRESGLGVTAWTAEGREGDRIVLMAAARRKLAPAIMRLIETADPGAFVVRTEPQAFRGGFLLKYLKSGATP